MKQWGAKPALIKSVAPELLSQPNIPKPLHGINPRTIMGDSAWRTHRQVVVTNNPYCKACGKETLQLDVHEDYKINYKTRTLTLNSYVPLCKTCHSFIHSGLLKTFLAQRKITRDRAVKTLVHGINILDRYSLPIFIGTYNLAKQLRVDTKELKSWSPGDVSWNGWVLLYNGKKYYGLTKQQWMQKYNNK